MRKGPRKIHPKSPGPLLLSFLIVTTIVSCSGWPKTAVSEPEGTPEPIGSHTSHDADIYGDLENLDPTGQTVTFWHQYTGAQEELLLELVDEFNRTNAWHITILAESQGGCDDLHQKIIGGLPTKQLPSMVTACQARAATYAAAGELTALAPYIESPKWGYSRQELDDFFPAALAADLLPQFGARYGWPSYRSAEVLYHNQDWLVELGYEGPPETWDEFSEMACAAIEQPFSGIKDEGAVLGYEYATNTHRFAASVFSRGGDIVNRNGTAYVFNGQAGLETLLFLKDLVDRGCAGSAPEPNRDQADFGAGQALFTISAVHRLRYYEQAVAEGVAFTWSVNPLPHGANRDRPRMNVYGISHSMFMSVPEEQLAVWLFIKWLSEPQQQAEWTSSTGYYPVRQSVAELMADYFAENPTREKAFGFMLLDYGIEPAVTGYDRCRSSLEEMLSSEITEADPQPQLDAAVEDCNAYLKEAAP